MTEELIELESHEKTSGVGWIIPNRYVRKSTLNRIFGWWLKDVGVLAPKEGSHIRRAMAMAISEQEVVRKLQGCDPVILKMLIRELSSYMREKGMDSWYNAHTIDLMRIAWARMEEAGDR